LSFLRLIRLPNLIILLLTLYLITHQVIYPPLITYRIAPSMTSKEYLLMLFIVACIGAGGYIYNDIIDQKTDEENEKEPVVGSKIGKKLALWSFIFILLAPLLPLASLIMELERPDFLWYYLGLSLILLLYNIVFKRLPLIGNLIIALLCGLAVYTPFFLESKALSRLQLEDPSLYKSVELTVLGFAVFAALSNLIREIIKDQEDVSGDKKYGQMTLPILIGQKATSYIAITLCILLGAVIYRWWDMMDIPRYEMPLIFVRFLLLIPLLNFSIRIYKAHSKEDYTRLSRYLKIYFGLGLLSLIVITL